MLEFLDETKDVHSGDTVVTSGWRGDGLSSLYPPRGLPIGVRSRRRRSMSGRGDPVPVELRPFADLRPGLAPGPDRRQPRMIITTRTAARVAGLILLFTVLQISFFSQIELFGTSMWDSARLRRDLRPAGWQPDRGHGRFRLRLPGDGLTDGPLGSACPSSWRSATWPASTASAGDFVDRPTVLAVCGIATPGGEPGARLLHRDRRFRFLAKPGSLVPDLILQAFYGVLPGDSALRADLPCSQTSADSRAGRRRRLVDIERWADELDRRAETAPGFPMRMNPVVPRPRPKRNPVSRRFAVIGGIPGWSCWGSSSFGSGLQIVTGDKYLAGPNDNRTREIRVPAPEGPDPRSRGRCAG